MRAAIVHPKRMPSGILVQRAGACASALRPGGTDRRRTLSVGWMDDGLLVPVRSPEASMTVFPAAYASPGRAALSARCALLLLVLPLPIWMVTWLDLWLAVPLAMGGMALLIRACRGPWRHWRAEASPGLLLAAGGLALFSSVGGYWIDAWLRNVHATILVGLVREPWPVWVDTLLPTPQEALLRRYLAWYVWPALAGRLWGPAVLDWLVPLYQWAGAALALHVVAHGLPRRTAPWLVAVFLGCGSLPWLAWHLYWTMPSVFHLVVLPELDHVNFLYALPQHWLPTVLFAALLILQRPLGLPVWTLPILMSTAPMWSWSAAVGCAPLAAWWAWRHRSHLVTPAVIASLLVAAAWCLVQMAYLVSGALEFLSGWVWNTLPPRGTAGFLAAAWAQSLPWLGAWLCIERKRQLPLRTPVAVGAVSVLLLPLFHFGPHNGWAQGMAAASVAGGIAWMRTVAGWAVEGRAARALGVFGAACLLVSVSISLVWLKADTLFAAPDPPATYNRDAKFGDLLLRVQAENAATVPPAYLNRLLRTTAGHPENPSVILIEPAPRAVAFNVLGTRRGALSFASCDGTVQVSRDTLSRDTRTVHLSMAGVRTHAGRACILEVLWSDGTGWLRGVWTPSAGPPVPFAFRLPRVNDCWDPLCARGGPH